MKPTCRLILLALIILVFGTVPVVHAAVPTDEDLAKATPVNCDDPSKAWPGNITDSNQIDYYSINLVAGQVLTIDVDTDGLSSLDSLLEVFDHAGNLIGGSDDDNAPDETLGVDPYFDITVDVDGTYYFAISAQTSGAGADTGSYDFFLGCSDQSSSPEFKWPLEVGDLVGARESSTGSLIKISPDNAGRSLPFPLGIGPITDIEFDPSRKLVFVAVEPINTDDYIPARIIAIDPASGSQVESYSLETESVVALEAAENKLYGVRVDSSGVNFTLAEVTFDSNLKTAKLTDVVSFGSDVVRTLAYNQSDKIMYGASGVDLLKVNLASSPVQVQTVTLTGLLSEISALDFSHKDVLYGVDRSGNLFNLPDLSSSIAVLIGEPIVGVNSLTFVVGAAPPNEEPVKTLCSSSLTSSTTASSETDAPKLSKLKLKNNPLHRAIGLFKFKGRAGETVTLKLAPEVEESVEAGEMYAVSELLESWLQRRGKGRVFLGIRDAIPNVDFRARKKDQIPFDMSADLPEDGDYYVMVIRPLLRFYQTDYCLTLESDHPDSEAWKTLDVVWPGDDSDEDSATTSTEAKTAEVQSDELSDEGFLGSEDTTPGETTGTVPTLTGSEPVSVAPATIAPEPVDEGSGQEVQGVEETAIGETGEVAPAEEPATEAIEESTVMGAPPIPEESTVDETGEVAPAEELTTEANEESTVMGAPSIPEESTVDETGEVAPAEEPATEAIEESTVMGAPPIPEETTSDEIGEVAPAVEPTAEATEKSTEMGAPPIPEETTSDEIGEVAPAMEPTAEATDEPIVKGAPSIPEEITVDETGEVAPDESADEISGDNESADGSGSAEVAEVNSDGAESAEGGTSDVVEQDPTEASTP